MTAPRVNHVVETERLILRRPLPEDAEGYTNFYLSDRAKYVGQTDKPYKAWSYFAAEIGHWEIRGWGMFAVVERATGLNVGCVGPYFPGGWNAPELGWLLWPAGEGKGYAREAAIAARNFAYGTLGWTTAISNIEPNNARSIAVAERLGCTLDPDAPRLAPGDLVYRHPSPEDL